MHIGFKTTDPKYIEFVKNSKNISKDTKEAIDLLIEKRNQEKLIKITN